MNLYVQFICQLPQNKLLGNENYLYYMYFNSAHLYLHSNVFSSNIISRALNSKTHKQADKILILQNLEGQGL